METQEQPPSSTPSSPPSSTSNPLWPASTSWIAVGSSLNDSISYDTSSTDIENNPEATPVLLVKPETNDPPPCEITIHFRKKHEIHRVYVRSTARVYEIYYSFDHQDNSKEYLCTVRCGAATGVVPEITSDALIPEQMVRSVSNNSDEDGWVKVKIPNPQEISSLKRRDSEIDGPKNQIHYEATAEISDVDPCLSLTIRLLSIQTKDCVHVDEIYVYADPVESCDSDPPANTGQNSGASSLFAMLAPSLMQLSKSATRQTKCLSDEAIVPKHQYGEAKTTETVDSNMGNSIGQEASSSKAPDKRWGPDDEQTEVNSLTDQNNKEACSRIEKVLDELVLKVERVELFCSNFEEKISRPLDYMGKKLEQLEQKLDSLAVRSESTNQCLCSRTVSSESEECYSENKGGPTSKQMEPMEVADDVAYSVKESVTRAGLVIKAPEFVNEDDDYSNTENIFDPTAEEFLPNEKVLSTDSTLASSLSTFLTSTNELTASSHESIIGNNNVVDGNAFHKEEDDCSNAKNTEDPFVEEVPKSKKVLSIDSALARSLAAFLTSANDQKRSSHKFINGTNNALDNNAFNNSVLENNGCDFKDDSSSLTCDAAIVDVELSTDTTHEVCSKSDAVTEGPTFDDLFSVANADVSSSSTSGEGSDIIVMSPKFLITCNSFDSDGTVIECPKLSNDISSNYFGFSRTDSNELSISTVVVPDEGDVALVIKNQDETEKEDDDCDAEKTLLHGSDQHNIEWKEYISNNSLTDKFITAAKITSENMEGEVRFNREKDWVSGLPLEHLLGDIADPELVKTSSSAGDRDCIANGNLGLRSENDVDGNSIYEVLSIPTKINKRTVEIITPVELTKKGDKVGSSEAALLAKLDVRPFLYDNEPVFSPEVLDLTEDDLVKKFATGVSMVASLSLALSYPNLAAAPHMFINAYKNVLAVAVATEDTYRSPEVLDLTEDDLVENKNVLAVSVTTEYTFRQAKKVKEYLKDPSKFIVAVAETGVAPAVANEGNKDEAAEDSDDEDLGFGLFDYRCFEY